MHNIRGILLATLLTLCVGAWGQESSLLAKCLGQPRSAYAKAFEDKSTWEKKAPHGKDIIGQYKTGSAMIEVIQTSGAKKPNQVNVYFYQEPKITWKDALTVIGISAKGVTAKEDSKHQFHLSHVKAGKSLKIDAVFIVKDSENNDSPTLHLTLK